MKKYTIYPLALCEPMPEAAAAFYYKDYKGAPVMFIYGCFCLEDNETGDLVMVDTGLASQEDITKYNYPFRRIDGAPNLKSVMDAKGLEPQKVKHIFFTHLHQDHCFNLELFPNAVMYVQKIELQHAVTPNPIEAKSYQKFKLPGLPAWAKAWGQIQTIEGDKKGLVDGIEVMFTPGHTPGSMSVIADTETGKYIMYGDLFYTVEQYEEGRMNGNFTSLDEWYHSRDKVLNYVKENNAQILMVHNPDTYMVDVYGSR